MKIFNQRLPFGNSSYRALRKVRSAGDEAQRCRDWLRSIAAYQKYLELRPTDGPIWVQLGHALKETKRFDEAEAAYRRALQLEPSYQDALRHLVAMLRSTGRNDEASLLDSSRDTLKAEIGDLEFAAPLDRNADHRRLGDRARDREDWELATQHYVTHLRTQPDDAAIWVQLGHTLKEQSYLDLAISAYKIGNELESTPSDVLLHMTGLLMQQGRTSEARPIWADMFDKGR